MPRIAPNDPLLAGFDPNVPLSLPALFGPEWGGVADFKKTAFADANYRQWSQITGRVVGNLGMLRGVPEWNLSGFSQFFAKMPLVKPSDVVSFAVSGIAKVVQISLTEAATAIPILGWVVQIGVGIYEGIKLAIEYKKSQKTEPPPGEAIEFSRDGNEVFAEQLIAEARGDDWTALFSPPSTSGKWSAKRVAWNPGGGGEGWAFGTRADLGWGLLPGLAECVGTLDTADRYTNYQFPDRTPAGLFASEYDIPPLSTTGALRPSSRQLAILLWQAVMKSGSVQAFNIDPYALVSRWTDYYLGLAEFAETLKTEKGVENAGFYEVSRGKNPKVPYNEAAIATTYLPYSSQPDGSILFATPENVPNWQTTAQIAAAPQGVSIAKLVSVIGADLTFTYADLVKYVCKIHIERSMASLSTLVCAYVPEDAPLLRASGAHREKWIEMRARLLEHDAVMKVELDLIPDGTLEDRNYRAAVQGKQYTRSHTPEGIDLAAAGKGGKPPKKGKPGDAPTVDGAPAPTMPDSPGPGMPGRIGRPSAGVGGWLGVAAGVLAIGATGALVLRKKRR